jgi:hypothetical protein
VTQQMGPFFFETCKKWGKGCQIAGVFTLWLFNMAMENP